MAAPPEAERPRAAAIRLIYAREMRDQLRDRRTVFTIVVLPILLYPLLGMLLLQVAQFSREAPTSLAIVGTERLPVAPELIGEAHGAAPTPVEEGQVQLSTYASDAVADSDAAIAERARNWVREGIYDAVVVVPPGFAAEPGRHPVGVLFNVGSDPSVVARDRAERMLERWRAQWIRAELAQSGVDPAVLRPFRVERQDIARESTRRAAFWSKLLPFVMLVWAMTGAFYPAIDLVAGEKERGTLETLLCSPALRSEIVWGKLLAVTTFSMATALLNVIGMQITAGFVFRHVGLGDAAGGAPPLGTTVWLLVALVPLSCLFSGLALSVAALARSSKEGQYYLMPLMMVSLPLVLLPLMPGTELNIGTSLIPVTGMFLLTRALVEAQYAVALIHLPVVAAVTVGCCLLAVRWARRQFESESVLFRDGEQWELGVWVRHLWRDRQAVPAPAQSLLAGAIILVGLFFARLAVATPSADWSTVASLVLLPQLGLILTPTLLMAVVLTTSLRGSLRLHRPAWLAVPAAFLLALTLHPSYVALSGLIRAVYPISEAARVGMQPVLEALQSAPFAAVLFVMAIVPAICEELAFRGFVMSGLVDRQRRLRAILITAVMFGMSHGMLQQSIGATVMGLVLGWIAIRTGSVLPGIVFHITHNALGVSIERLLRRTDAVDGPLRMLVRSEGDAWSYEPAWLIGSAIIATTVLVYFGTLRTARGGEAESEVAFGAAARQPAVG